LWTQESSEEEFIPQHRIVYFKRKSGNGVGDEVVWNRRERVDGVFGSGNGGVGGRMGKWGDEGIGEGVD
jgi:hypothetical protein